MSAELLREASATLRERAAAATPGPWRVGAEGSEGARINPASGTKREQVRFLANVNGREQPQDGRNAAYISTMHPGVGLALADWLDAEAVFADYGTQWVSRHAPIVARLILGEQ